MKMAICDGCNVRSPWEHRCHKENAYVGGEASGKPCDCNECRWEVFFFASDEYFGLVDSRLVWATKVVPMYVAQGGVSHLRGAKKNPNLHDGVPSFGFRTEHVGPRTLGEWADQKGINLNTD